MPNAEDVLRYAELIYIPNENGGTTYRAVQIMDINCQCHAVCWYNACGLPIAFLSKRL